MERNTLKRILIAILAATSVATATAALAMSSMATEDETVSPPPEYVIPEDSLIYTHEVMPDTWVFTDGLGRTSLTNAEVGNPREGKEIAMFFWTWHLGRPQPLNVNDAVEQYPVQVDYSQIRIFDMITYSLSLAEQESGDHDHESDEPVG